MSTILACITILALIIVLTIASTRIDLGLISSTGHLITVLVASAITWLVKKELRKYDPKVIKETQTNLVQNSDEGKFNNNNNYYRNVK